MDTIMTYLTKTLNQSKYIAEKNYNSICKYEDIKTELIFCIENESFPENGIVVEGYSAKEIHRLAPFMNYLGVYNFMVSLRDNPQTTKEIIKTGFIIK